jgi:hypothetical protein
MRGDTPKIVAKRSDVAQIGPLRCGSSSYSSKPTFVSA